MNIGTTRPYKHDSPENTVARIQGLLASVGCSTHLGKWRNPYTDVYSVKIIADVKHGRFSTSGKGRTRAYTLASGYAEFIERLQNGLMAGKSFTRLFMNQIKRDTGFYYMPDEKFITKDEFDALPEGFLRDVFVNTELTFESSQVYFDRLKANGYPGCLAVPYYDVRGDKVVYFPHNIMHILTGSNGMAAGNTMAEGLFQGICELLERYGASQVYYNRLTPPTIPREFIAEHAPNEYRLIQEIEEAAPFRIIVKDFSAEERLPVVGVVIIDEANHRYRLNVGSETWFAVALSRCLTEIHQGVGHWEHMQKSLLPIPEKEHDHFLLNDRESERERNRQFLHFCENGRGVFPKTLFGDTADYAFNPGAFIPRDSYENEVGRLIDLLLDNGRAVYLRDVSFLGFPSFHIYVPVVSPIGKKSFMHATSIDLHIVAEVDKVEDLFFPFEECDEKKMSALAAILEKTSLDTQATMKDKLKLEFVESSDWDTLPVSFFLTLLWHRLGHPDKAGQSLDRFIRESRVEKHPYYQAVRRFFTCRTENQDDEETKKLLKKDGFDGKLIAEVLSDLADRTNVFDSIKIPACPNCDSCSLADECLTRPKMELTRRVNMHTASSKISQPEQFRPYARPVVPA